MYSPWVDPRGCVTCGASLLPGEEAVCEPCMRGAVMKPEHILAIVLGVAIVVGLACLFACVPAHIPAAFQPLEIQPTPHSYRSCADEIQVGEICWYCVVPKAERATAREYIGVSPDTCLPQDYALAVRLPNGPTGER